MTARQQWTVVAIVVAFVAAGLALASHFMKDDLYQVMVGSPAPNFAARTLDGGHTRSLADYKGQVVILNVWATYCIPCQKELPSFERLYQEYGPKGLKLVAVSVDQGVSDDSIRTFAKNFGVTFEVLHDSSAKIEEAYQTTGYPETFVIGREGDIRKKFIGADDWSSQGNRALVAQLLGLETPRQVVDSVDGPAASSLPPTATGASGATAPPKR